jgi:hypothetical protein
MNLENSSELSITPVWLLKTLVISNGKYFVLPAVFTLEN